MTLPSACLVALADRGGGWRGAGEGAWGAREAFARERGFHANRLCPQVAPKSQVGPSGRSEGGGHPSAVHGPSPPPSAPSQLGELGLIPGVKLAIPLSRQG